MASSKTLVCENESDVPKGKSAIIISEHLSQIDTQNCYELFEQLLSLEVDSQFETSVYEILSETVWRNGFGLHDNTTGWMDALPILYKNLDDKIGDEVDIIECVGVSGRHLDLIHDLSKNRGLEMQVRDSPEETVTDYSLAVRAIGWVVLSVFDAVFSLLVRPFFSPADADVLVKYPIFRTDTFQPIEERFDISFDTTFTLFTISYFVRVRSIVAEDTSVVPLRCFDSIRGLISSYWTIAVLGYDTIFAREQESAVVEAVEKETGVRMEQTVGRLYRRAVLGNIKPLLYAMTAQRLFENNTYESLMITSTGPTGKALALPAADHGVDTYVLHHSITTPNEIYDNSYDRTLFSEGEIVDHPLQATNNDRMKCINTGLPKHLDIASQRKNDSSTEKTNTVVLGTQPFNDRYRREFIYNVVPPILEETSWNIVIKTHPAEKPKFYTKILEEYTETLSTDRIQITDADLYSHIQQGDLLITVNSNVGIEAVILGTPVVTYNMWQPELRNALYTTHGSVPGCSTATEFRTLLVERDLETLRTAQQQMLTDSYMVAGNSIDQITDRIQTELKG